ALPGLACFPPRRSSDLAIRLRCSTFAVCETRWNQRERMSAGGSTAKETSPRRQSAISRAVTAAGSRITFETSVGMPCDSTSETRSEEHTSELQSPYELV